MTFVPSLTGPPVPGGLFSPLMRALPARVIAATMSTGLSSMPIAQVKWLTLLTGGFAKYRELFAAFAQAGYHDLAFERGRTP